MSRGDTQNANPGVSGVMGRVGLLGVLRKMILKIESLSHPSVLIYSTGALTRKRDTYLLFESQT